MSNQMVWLLALSSGPLLFATIVGIYDLLARRQHRQREQQRRSA